MGTSCSRASIVELPRWVTDFARSYPGSPFALFEPIIEKAIDRWKRYAGPFESCRLDAYPIYYFELMCNSRECWIQLNGYFFEFLRPHCDMSFHVIMNRMTMNDAEMRIKTRTHDVSLHWTLTGFQKMARGANDLYRTDLCRFILRRRVTKTLSRLEAIPSALVPVIATFVA